jgi:hypothetical protein
VEGNGNGLIYYYSRMSRGSGENRDILLNRDSLCTSRDSNQLLPDTSQIWRRPIVYGMFLQFHIFCVWIHGPNFNFPLLPASCCRPRNHRKHTALLCTDSSRNILSTQSIHDTRTLIFRSQVDCKHSMPEDDRWQEESSIWMQFRAFVKLQIRDDGVFDWLLSVG